MKFEASDAGKYPYTYVTIFGFLIMFCKLSVILKIFTYEDDIEYV